MNNLIKYGINSFFTAQALQYPELSIARVISQYRDLYKIATSNGECLAEVSGKFRFKNRILSNFPVVGDFVMFDECDSNTGHMVIHDILSRQSKFERVAVGKTKQTQLIAANIDIVFICMSLNNDYNLSRLERYLITAWDSGGTPIIILTKSDLCDDLSALLSEVSTVAAGVDILPTSSHDKNSYKKLLSYLREGVTASFIGSSGVGKSTLINCLAGKKLLTTSPIRKDDKGRHTSTRRELIVLPDGGIVIDNPGMRELGIEAVDLSRSFADIETLIQKCKFNDCKHDGEPGCAVHSAIECGELDSRRLKNYRKLLKEARYSGLDSKQIEVEKCKQMFSKVGGMKKARKLLKQKKDHY